MERDGAMLARGGWTGLCLPAAKDAFILNGQPVAAAINGGYLTYGAIPASAAPAPAADVECPLSVQIAPAVARLAPGGRRTVTFTVKNTLKTGVSGSFAFELPKE